MIKVEGIEGKEIKFVCNDGFTVRCFGDGTIYEDVNNYYCIPNFHNMEPAGGVLEIRVHDEGGWISLIARPDKTAEDCSPAVSFFELATFCPRACDILLPPISVTLSAHTLP